MQTIWVSKGKRQYVGGVVREGTGKNIQGATFTIGLGDESEPPDTFVTPSLSEQGATEAERRVRLLVAAPTAPGTYWCWINVEDDPEILPVRVDEKIIVR